MDAMIPPEVRELLSPFLPAGTPWDVDLRFQRIGLGRVSSGPMSLASRAVTAVTAVGAARNLQPVGRSRRDVVTLDPRFGDLETAAGLALLGHEMWHQHQYKTIPDFEDLYADADEETPEDRPWENPFEWPAYSIERDIYCDLTARGVPAGDWLPLGVELWGC